MTTLSRTAMEAILFAHGKAELDFDVDATMATVVADPHYEIACLGLAVDGWDAVTEMYRRLLAGNRGRNIAAEERASALAGNTLMSEARVWFDSRTGDRACGHYLIVVSFDPVLHKVIGERIYTDPVFGRLWAENLGADFADLPGVSPIARTAPSIDRHDAFDAAAARGMTIRNPRVRA